LLFKGTLLIYPEDFSSLGNLITIITLNTTAKAPWAGVHPGHRVQLFLPNIPHDLLYIRMVVTIKISPAPIGEMFMNENEQVRQYCNGKNAKYFSHNLLDITRRPQETDTASISFGR